MTATYFDICLLIEFRMSSKDLAVTEVVYGPNLDGVVEYMGRLRRACFGTLNQVVKDYLIEEQQLDCI